jgi:hypothetical protein
VTAVATVGAGRPPACVGEGGVAGPRSAEPLLSWLRLFGLRTSSEFVASRRSSFGSSNGSPSPPRDREGKTGRGRQKSSPLAAAVGGKPGSTGTCCLEHERMGATRGAWWRGWLFFCCISRALVKKKISPLAQFHHHLQHPAEPTFPR